MNFRNEFVSLRILTSALVFVIHYNSENILSMKPANNLVGGSIGAVQVKKTRAHGLCMMNLVIKINHLNHVLSSNICV